MDTARVFAYLLVAWADAWDRLAAELRIDLRALQAGLPGAGNLEQADRQARGIALSADEMAAQIRARHGLQAVPLTAELIFQSLLDYVRHRAGEWG